MMAEKDTSYEQKKVNFQLFHGQ